MARSAAWRARWLLVCAIEIGSVGCGEVSIQTASGVDTGFGLPGDTVSGAQDAVDGANTADGSGDGDADDDVGQVDGEGADVLPDTVVADTVGTDTVGTDAADTADAADAADTEDAADSADAADAADAADVADVADSADAKPTCVPTGNELCNGQDDDCDGETDEAGGDDAEPCTKDTCLGVAGCAFEPLTTGCDDGDPCTGDDGCTLTGCKGGTATDCDDDDECTQDACEPGTGCVHAPGFGSCDDGKTCTNGDVCTSGGCVGKAIGCDDGNVCTTDSCVEPTGCTHTPATSTGGASIPCADGNACTSGDACTGGTCAGVQQGGTGSCDDGNACTDDGCDVAKGCTHTPNQAACDDGDACTTGDVCGGGACKSSGSKVCDDGSVCTSDSCDSAKGCVATALADGSACAEGVCTGGVCGPVATGCKGDELSGAFVIGKGGDYPTFAAALAALKSGVCGDVTFTVQGGTYAETGGFVFAPIPGAGPAARVRFEAAAGQKVRLVGQVPGSSNTGVVKIDGSTSWLTLVGFELDGKQPGNLINGSYAGPVVFSSAGGQQHVRIEGFYIHDFGPAAWKTYTYLGAIYMQQNTGTTDVQIVGNRFENIQPPQPFHTQGGIATRNGPHKGLRIVGNHFEGIVGMPCIKLRNGAGWDDVLVANNRFVVPDGQSALEFYGTNTLVGEVQFVFNSVLLLGAGQAVKGSLTGGTLGLRNNAVRSLGKGALVSGTPLGPLGANCLESVSPATSPAANPADVIGTVAFVASAPPFDLHLQPKSACLDKGVALPSVKDDMDGEVRANPPDIGADEKP